MPDKNTFLWGSVMAFQGAWGWKEEQVGWYLDRHPHPLPSSQMDVSQSDHLCI